MEEHIDVPENPRETAQLLIFDLDVFLENARQLRAHALARALAQLAQERDLDLEALHDTTWSRGFQGIEQTLDLLGAELDEEGLTRLLELVQDFQLREVQSGRVRLHSLLADMVARLHDCGYHTVLLSADSRAYMMGVIDYFELDRYIDFAVCIEDVSSRDLNLALLEILDNQEVLRSEALLLTNRAPVLSTARQLQIQSVGCQWGDITKHELQLADRIITSPTRLVEWLAPEE
jgi:phosphoglycolate phosphatase-like HAD superfamily hydrolase